MAQNRGSLFQQLTRMFKSGPIVKRKVRNADTRVAAPDLTGHGSSILLLSKTAVGNFNSIISGGQGYVTQERMSRLQDFNEMDAYAEINAALDIYADESVAQDAAGKSIHIHSDNPAIKKNLEELFYNTLNAEFNLRPWTRNLVKYGDFFLYVDVSPEYGVINVVPIPVNELTREEGFDPNDPLAIRFRWMTLGNRTLENWEVAHFRLMGNDQYLPYGSSMLDGARRIWRQLVLIEDAMLVYRVTRSPERRVFYVDVGGVPPDEIPNYMEAAKTNIKSSQVADRATGRVDLRYNPLPVASTTLIPLLDGRIMTICDLAAEFDAGKHNMVYSIQDETNRIVPGYVKWCGKNYHANELIRVWLDDGTYVDTAPEHPYILRDGSSKRADELQVGQSLMPFYTKVSSSTTGDKLEGYEKIYDPGLNSWSYTHRALAEVDVDLVEQKQRVLGTFDRVHNKHMVLHHINFDKLNNRTDNLMWMGENDHFLLHSRNAKLTNIKHGLGQRMAAKYNGTCLFKQHNEIRRESQLRSWKEDSVVRRSSLKRPVPDYVVPTLKAAIKKNPKLGYKKAHKILVETTNFVEDVKKMTSRSGKSHDNVTYWVWLRALNEMGYGLDAEIRDLDKNERRIRRQKTYCFFREAVLAEATQLTNHKVAHIEIIPGDDVYCMTIVGSKGEDDRHNFAVVSKSVDSNKEGRSGIFLKNSVEEDYWIPVRGSDTNTRIDTLQAGQNTGNVEDVQYIQKKLIAALKVPAAYLGYNDAIPGCFVGSTPIPSTNGKIYRIDELDRMYQVGEAMPNVLSWDASRRTCVPGKILRAWETKKTNTLARVTLRSSLNGTDSVFECTPDHRFLLNDGTYVAASELVNGTAIRSMYGRYHEGLHCRGYHQTLTENGKWEYTHRLFARQKYGKVSGSEIVHHVDFDKLNNDPSNLLVCASKHVHNDLHAAYNRINKVYVGANNPNYNNNVTFDQLIEVASNCSDKDQVCIKLGVSSRVVTRLVKEAGMSWLEFVDRHMPLNKCARNFLGCGVTIEDIKNYMYEVDPLDTSSPKVGAYFGISSWAAQNIVKRAGFASWKEFRSSLIQQPADHEIVNAVQECGSIVNAWREKYRRVMGISRFQPLASRACKEAGMHVHSGAGNHNVINVEIITLSEPVPVYDLEIDHYHNFAVGSQVDAVYVHNSSGLAQVDVRFSRTVNMIQRTIVSELNKIAMIHLFTAGFRGDDLIDFEIRLSNPSTIAQQQKLELLRTRFEIAGAAPPAGPGADTPLMSERWIQRNVMGLNDQEILQNKRERLDDVRAAGALEAAGVLPGEGAGAGGEGELEPDTGAETEAGGTETGGPGLETAADDNRGQGDLITSTVVDGETRVREDDSPVKLMPGIKKAGYNRRRNLRRRTHGKVNVLDRAVSGETIKPSMPENRSPLREAFQDVYDNAEDPIEEFLSSDQSALLLQEAALAPTITVKPIIGQTELRMMRELSVTKNLTMLNPENWNNDKRRERVLLEHFAPSEQIVEYEDVNDFELYDDAEDESNDD